MRHLPRAAVVALLLLSTFAFTNTAQAAASCMGKTVTVDIAAGQTPTSGNDVIRGTSGADTINAGAGDDTVCGRGGNDTINGQSGHDHIDGGDGNDTLYGSWGNDTINGGAGIDTMYGNGGADTMNGQGGNDVLDGGGGADKLFGSWGDDTLNGGSGWDNLNGNGGHDLLNGQSGDDIVYGEGGNDRIWGADGKDTLWGGNGADTIRGGWGNDTIDGEGGGDTIFGEGHDDVINGGWGTDTLDGGDGDDTLIGGPAADTANGGIGTDNCDAETETTCEDVVVAPTWVAGAQLVLEAVSPFDFKVSWGPYSGTPHSIELQLTDSNGVAANPEIIDVRRNSSWDIGTFNTYVLKSNETYSLSAVLVNEAGRSSAIELSPIAVLGVVDHLEADLAGERVSLGSDASAGPQIFGTDTRSGSGLFSRIVSPLGGNDCPIDPFTVTSYRTWGWWKFETGRHEAKSKFCTDGEKVISSDTSVHDCTKDGQDDTDSEISAPPGAQPNSPIVRNLYLCSWEGDFTAKIRGDISKALTKGKVGEALVVDFGTEFNFDGSHSIQHTIEVEDGGVRVLVEHWNN